MEDVRLTSERAQVIVTAAFIVAIGVLVLSALLNGLIFSQDLATRDDGAEERTVIGFSQDAEEAVSMAMTGNRTTPSNAKDEFDLFMNLYETEMRKKYASRQSAVSIGPTNFSDPDLNGTLVWALGQRCDIDNSTTDCSLVNESNAPEWNAVENNTGNVGNAFDSPHKYTFTVKRPDPGDPFQVDAVRNESTPKRFDTDLSLNTTAGDWRMVIDDDEILFQKVDSIIGSNVLVNTTTVDWSAVGGDDDEARIDILNESIDGKDVAVIGNGTFTTPSTYPGELKDTDKNYLRFWNGSSVEGEYDIRLNKDTFENDITGPCDASCSKTGDRDIYAVGVVHEVEGIRASYTDSDVTHSVEIDHTLRKDELILEDR